jgi:phosphoribosyl 1,2-cyclic phosphate phosphodiesterase
MTTVTLLGTGGSAGVPMLGGPDGRGDWGACDPGEPRNRRTRTSAVIDHGGARLLVDASPDLREQLLATATARVDALLVTHAHADHIAGIDDLRGLNRALGGPLPLFGSAATLDELQRRFDYAFAPWDGVSYIRPILAPRVIAAGDVFVAGGVPVRVFQQDHGFMTTLGVRVGGFAYCTDVVTLDEAALAALRGIHTWAVDCFQRAPGHRTHAWVGRVLEWVAALRPRRTVLTHMGHDVDWAEMRRILPPGVEPGHDGQILDVPDQPDRG